MNMQSQQMPELQLYDIYGLWYIPFWQRTWFIILLCISLTLCIGLIFYLIIKRIRSRKQQLTAWQRALHRLQQLKKEELLTRTQSERFYVQLTSLLKAYMSDRYKEDVRSHTDQQMIVYIDQIELFDNQKEPLRRIFCAGELIKFAHQDALEQQMLQDWDYSVNFVKMTKDEPEKMSAD